MRNLDVKIDFISNPINNDRIRFKVTDNNQVLTYNSEQTIIDKTFRNSNIVSRDKISRYTSQLTEDNANFGNFTGGDVFDIVPIYEYIYSPNNGFIVVGSFTHYNGIPCDKAVRLDINGNFVNAFGTFNDEVLTAVVVDNFVVFGGNFTSITPISGGAISKNRIYGAFWNGTANATFNNNTGNGFNGRVYKLKFIDNISISLSSLDLILAGGEFTSFNGSSATSKVCTINKSGTNSNVFLSQFGSTGAVRDIEVEYTSFPTVNVETVKLYIVGSFTVAGRDNILKTNIIGNIDSTFDCGTDDAIYSVVLGSNNVPNEIYFGGNFDEVNFTPMRRLACVNKDTGILLPTFVDREFNGTVYKVETNVLTNRILVGGDFTSFNSNAVSYFIQVNRTTNELVNDLLFNAPVFTILYDNISVLVGGQYTQLQGGSASLPNIITIGANSTASRNNLLANLLEYNLNDGVIYTTGTTFINFNYEYPDFNLVEISEVLDAAPRVILVIENESLNFTDLVKGVRVRSPYILKSQINEFDTTEFKIWTYTGGAFDYSLYDPNYTLTKQKIVPTQNNTYINFSNLVNDGLNSNVATYLANSLVLTPLDNSEGKWVFVESRNRLLGDEVSFNQNLFFILDGYIEENQIQNIPRVLTTGLNKYYHKNSKPRLHFRTDNLQEIRYYNGFLGLVIEVQIPQGNNVNFIQSFPIYPQFMDRIELVYNNETISLNVNQYQDCRNPLYDVVFKNKYGVLETLSFSKVSKSTLDVERSHYTSNLLDVNGNKTRPYGHFKKNFNTIGREKLTLNTDWMPEYMNPQIEELFLSEEIYLVDVGKLTSFDNPSSRSISLQTAIKPVNLVSSQFNKKTKLNDKLIQYTIEVEYSNDKINNLI
jgi:hypothetical protein